MAGGIELLSLNKSFFRRVTLILMTFIVLLTGLYTLIVSVVVGTTEDYILQAYLQNERQSFISQYQLDASTPLPSSSYLQVFRAGDISLPTAVSMLSEGNYELNEREGVHVLVTDLPDGDRLYFLLEERRFSLATEFESRMKSALWLVAFCMTVVGLLLAIWIARMISRPVLLLASELQGDLPDERSFHGANRQDEIGLLSRVLSDLVKRLTRSLQTEKAFTRHTSHELRTPLGIIRNSLAVLKLPGCSAEKQLRSVQRIERACEQSERITNAFLLLGNSQQRLECEVVDLNKCLRLMLEEYQPLALSRGIDYRISGGASIIAPPALLNVLLENLLRNALNYGEDFLQIQLSGHRLQMLNPVSTAMSEQDSYGYGLEIVCRICERCNWQLSSGYQQQSFCVDIQFTPP
ncbi:sensor histidine kinase [Aliamphritea ceti]|uniref:sensor histidine kinase n=1 Tax=Aliamphritea ceti TaxID=1524258 RepID=UPI0021C4A25C|nr:HAMP domain-containing sensor histidine kinase [Aliamphritea ceti]